MSEKNLEKDINQTGDFFKYLYGSMKLGMPVWDDFIQRGQRFQRSLEQSIVAFNSFLDGFAKLAELATNSKGATHEIGVSLTNMIRWQKALELKIRELNFSLSTKVLTPVSHRIDEWKKQLSGLDKDHEKEMNRPIKEAKELVKTTIKSQKTLESKRRKKGTFTHKHEQQPLRSVNKQSLMDDIFTLDKQVPNLQAQLEQLQVETDQHIADVEQKEKVHMSRMMVEERVWFATLINAFMTVLDQLVTVGTDFDRLPNLMADLKESTNSPSILPEAKRDFIEEWQIPSVNTPRLKLGNNASGSSNSHNASSLNISNTPANIPRLDSNHSFDTSQSDITISSPIMNPTPPPPQDPPNFTGYVQNPSMAPPTVPQQQSTTPSYPPPEDHYDVPVLPPTHVSISPSQVSLVSNGSHNSSESTNSSTRSASPQLTRNSLPSHHGQSHYQTPPSAAQTQQYTPTQSQYPPTQNQYTPPQPQYPPTQTQYTPTHQPQSSSAMYQSPAHSYSQQGHHSSNQNDLSFVNRADMTPSAMKYIPATLPRPRKDSNPRPTAPKPVRPLQQQHTVDGSTGHPYKPSPQRIVRQASLPEQDNNSDDDDENLSAFALALKQKKLKKTIRVSDRSTPNI